jgi:hypothetical protein
MPVSEAQLAANRANGARSLGPRTIEGKMNSRMNACKHLLTAQVAVAEGDTEAIRSRIKAFMQDLRPKTEVGTILIGQMATLSVRMERAAEHETAAIALKVRHAADDFDDERFDQANAVFEGLAHDPRATLRKLKRMPEGVEKLVEAWTDLLNDLTLEPSSGWTDEQLEQVANLTGLKSRHAKGSRLAALNRAIRGDFAGLDAGDGAGLSLEARKTWAKSALLDLIEAEVVALEAHYETLDHETLAIDRAEAGQRAIFDASKPACLARRYESEARRGFFRALKEFQRVEAEAQAQTQVEPTPKPSEPARAASSVGSFRENAPTPAREPARTGADTLIGFNPAARPSQNQPVATFATGKTTG